MSKGKQLKPILDKLECILETDADKEEHRKDDGRREQAGRHARLSERRAVGHAFAVRRRAWSHEADCDSGSLWPTPVESGAGAGAVGLGGGGVGAAPPPAPPASSSRREYGCA